MERRCFSQERDKIDCPNFSVCKLRNSQVRPEKGNQPVEIKETNEKCELLENVLNKIMTKSKHGLVNLRDSVLHLTFLNKVKSIIIFPREKEPTFQLSQPLQRIIFCASA